MGVIIIQHHRVAVKKSELIYVKHLVPFHYVLVLIHVCIYIYIYKFFWIYIDIDHLHITWYKFKIYNMTN